MCYSAMVEEEFRHYLRMTGAEMDLQQFAEIYGLRASGVNVRIARCVDRWFDAPQTPEARRIKDLIDAYRNGATVKLETELFAQKRRLADAERKLQVKQTKAASESRRIAIDKIAQALARLPLLKDSKPHAADGRVFPMHYVPLVVKDGERTVLKLARYHCRQAGKPASIDRQFPGLYNARRDNIEKFWRNEFTQQHGLMLVNSFYENVERDGKNAVLCFVPKPAGTMFIACLYSRWVDPKDGELLSFAAITDEPPAEVAAAGHDRMIVNIQQHNIDRWLSPRDQTVEELQAILSDRQTPYYEHQVLAA
ncbi:MAG: SOS response-associated peptidase family protein [Steroidobacteraceae bacterium]